MQKAIGISKSGLILMKLKVFWKVLFRFSIRLSGHTMQAGIIRKGIKDISMALGFRPTMQV